MGDYTTLTAGDRTRVPGTIGLVKALHHRHVKLVLYPGEAVTAAGVTVGHIYVFDSHSYASPSKVYHAGHAGHIHVSGKPIVAYEAAGGPPPDQGGRDRGGHTKGVTPTGFYRLGPAEHHATKNWPMSAIPWGAKLRMGADGEIEYFDRGRWEKATGSDGAVTQALKLFKQRDGEPVTGREGEEIRGAFFDTSGNLLPEWDKNDFGKWSWNLMKGSQRTAYYIHTTPEDERATAEHRNFLLAQSHGCVHIRPSDRNEMMRLGYLRSGIEVEVMPYGRKRCGFDWRVDC